MNGTGSMTLCIGVCSWSLQPSSVEDLADKICTIGSSSSATRPLAVQLALDPLRTGAWAVDRVQTVLGQAGIEIRSGMMAMRGEDYSTLGSIRRTGGVRPNEHWQANLDAAAKNARIASALDIGLVTFHAGFIPHDRSDPVRAILMDRLRTVIDRFAEHGVRVAFETGQETAETLLAALEELSRPEAGVNFDPANMILYGMGDPVAGLRTLAPRVFQVHIKDAVASTEVGAWGTEVAVGEGDVDWRAFFSVVRETRLACDFMIEREAGGNRFADINGARGLVESLFITPDNPKY